ncbi:MAG: hypothetical protein ACLQA5_11185 [Solirubrobacteraceae bacterium]
MHETVGSVGLPLTALPRSVATLGQAPTALPGPVAALGQPPPLPNDAVGPDLAWQSSIGQFIFLQSLAQERI